IVAHLTRAAPGTSHVVGVRLADPGSPDVFSRRAGAFVTLHCKGELRGCIGHVGTDRTLAQVIGDCAFAACSADPRFPPVAAAELDALRIEVSILSPFESVSGLDEVIAGRHGLVAERGSQRGLLLPQVATEHGWDAATLAANTCLKAGLPRDAW